MAKIKKPKVEVVKHRYSLYCHSCTVKQQDNAPIALKCECGGKVFTYTDNQLLTSKYTNLS